MYLQPFQVPPRPIFNRFFGENQSGNLQCRRNGRKPKQYPYLLTHVFETSNLVQDTIVAELKSVTMKGAVPDLYQTLASGACEAKH